MASRVSFLVGLLVLGVAIAQTQGRKDDVVTGAENFIKSMTAEQKARALKGFDDDYRKNWRFVPASREGVNLGELNPEQATIAAKLLKSSLSEAGYKRVETIKGLEDVLFEMENGNKGRDKRLYTFTFFGEPTTRGTWAWRYEGHHVSLNFTFKDGNLISSSPQFFGSNPAEVRSGPHKGLRALPQEQDLAFALLDSFTPAELAKAVVGDTAPYEIVTGNNRKIGIQDKSGIAYKDLSSKQKEALAKLLRVHAESQSGAELKRRWGRVDLDSVVFAWMGSTKPGKGHYYRIQGSKFLVEYDNTQNDANHIHAVWRDFEGDFGEDVLAEHYSSVHIGRH